MVCVRTHSSAGFGAHVLSATPAWALRPPPQMTLCALLLRGWEWGTRLGLGSRPRQPLLAWAQEEPGRTPALVRASGWARGDLLFLWMASIRGLSLGWSCRSTDVSIRS